MLTCFFQSSLHYYRLMKLFAYSQQCRSRCIIEGCAGGRAALCMGMCGSTVLEIPFPIHHTRIRLHGHAGSRLLVIAFPTGLFSVTGCKMSYLHAPFLFGNTVGICFTLSNKSVSCHHNFALSSQFNLQS